jgi:hypothetical protein
MWKEIIEALIKASRCHDGIDPNIPISDQHRVELETRILAHLAAKLGICSPGSVKTDHIELQLLELKDKHENLKWVVEGDNGRSSL